MPQACFVPSESPIGTPRQRCWAWLLQRPHTGHQGLQLPLFPRTPSVQLPVLHFFPEQGDLLCPLWLPTHLRPDRSASRGQPHVHPANLPVDPAQWPARSRYSLHGSAQNPPVMADCPAALRPSAQKATCPRSRLLPDPPPRLGHLGPTGLGSHSYSGWLIVTEVSRGWLRLSWGLHPSCLPPLLRPSLLRCLVPRVLLKPPAG